MIINPEIELDQHRCFDCGRYYFTERGCNQGCNVCLAATAKRRWEEINHLERVIRGLRGALKQKRGRK